MMILLRESLVASRISLLSLTWVQRGVFPKGSCIVSAWSALDLQPHSTYLFVLLLGTWPDMTALDGMVSQAPCLTRTIWSPYVPILGPGEKTSDQLPQVRHTPQVQSSRACPEWQGHAVLTWMGGRVQVGKDYELGRNLKAAHFLLLSSVIKRSSFLMPWYPRLSVGFELLRKMGWKEGQGIGPRVKRRPRRQKPGMYIDCH